MVKFRASFTHNQKEYNLFLRPLSPNEKLPKVFQVYDEANYFHGQLIFYERDGIWFFHNEPGIADILGDLVVRWWG